MRPLETERLAIELLRPSHAAELFDELHDPEVYKYVDDEMPTDLQSLTKRYTALESTGPDDGSEIWLNWVARERDTDLAVAHLQATVFKNDESKEPYASIGYIFVPSVQGRGLATEGVAAMNRHLFEDVGVQRIEATVDEDNIRSIRLLNRLVFIHASTSKPRDTNRGPIRDFTYESRCCYGE